MIKSLLIKHLGITLLHVIVLFSLLVVGFTHYLSQSQRERAAVLQQFVDNSVVNDPKLLARQLRRAYNFQSINIQQLDGTSLYQYIAQEKPSALSYGLFKILDIIGKTTDVSQTELNIKVSYELSTVHELSLFDTLMALVMIVPLLFGALQLSLINRNVDRSFSKIAQQLSDNIALLIVGITDSHQPAPNWSAIPTRFNRVAQSVQKLASAISQHITAMENANALIKTQAFKDDLTDLPNRNRFVEFFEELLNNEGSLKFGMLAIIRATELQHINQTLGYQEGDLYIKTVADKIGKVANSYTNHQLYRLNGSDFACIIPSITQKQSESFGQSLQDAFNRYQKEQHLDSVAYTGIVAYQPGQPLGELLALTDTAISIAQTKHSNSWHLQKETDILQDNSASYGQQNWRRIIEDVIEHKRVALTYQIIQPCARGNKTYSEVLTRFKNSENEILPTVSFLAMAEKLDKIAIIDRLIVDTTIDFIKTQALNDQCFGINITPRTVYDEQFMIWLERRLLKESVIASKLIFEVTEIGLQQNIKASKHFIDMLHRVGSRVTVERFGVGLTSFKFFRDLKPDFIKMDGSYTRNIDQDKNNQYFLRLIIDLAHRLDVNVLAEGVEHLSEKIALEKLFIDGVQGYHIGKPKDF